MKVPARYKTKSGRRPRARVHAGGTPLSRRRTRQAALRTLAAVTAALLVVVLAANAYASSFMDSLPDVKGLSAAGFRGDALVYDRNGVLLADVGSQGDHRLDVKLDQVSPKLVEATVAVEDKSFWSNSGVDPEGILRAGLANLRRQEIVGGGSTITQQLAKQLFLSPDQTYERKLKEVALAYELNRTYSKRQILELYLNQNNYGEHQYGVEAASRSYFHKDAKNLDLAEAAMLAGLPQAPYAWDPIAHPDAAKARQKQVLDAMVRVGYATPDEAAAAGQEKLAVYPPASDFLAPHFVDYVLSELDRLGFKLGQKQITVRTTLDYGRQKEAEQVVRDNLQKNLYRDRGGRLSSALVAMDPKSGQILAYVGSPGLDTPGGQYDFVSGVDVSPGSSVKPYTYAAALYTRRITEDTQIYDGPSPYKVSDPRGGPPFPVYNYDHRAYGLQPARVALDNSLNISAVKVEQAVGVPYLVDFYRSLGLQPLDYDGKPNGPDTNYGPLLTLGAHYITLLQHVTALATLADLGLYHEPEAVLTVADAQGHVLYQADPSRGQRQALPPGVAFIVSSMLADDANRALVFGRGTPLHLADHRAAAKTGTSDGFKDALTVGWTPDLAAVLWVGDILGSSHTMSAGSDGIYVAAPGWHTFMEEALKGVADDWYAPPSGVVKGPGNSWYLSDATSIPHLPNEAPTPPPTQTDAGVPADPGTGPVLATPAPHG